VIRLLVVAETRLYREGLTHLLDGRAGLRVVGAVAANGGSLNADDLSEFDIAVLDSTMAGAVSVVRVLREVRPQAKIVAVAVSETEEEVIACAEAGISAYVPHEGSTEDLVVAIQKAARDELVCSAGIAAALMKRVAVLAAQLPAVSGTAHLTRRELEILRLLDDGFSNKQIASKLHIALSTVKNHVHAILEKLGVQGRAAAVAWARQTESVESGI
jgi:two-component system nitrate/nitrite response regulator NarL